MEKNVIKKMLDQYRSHINPPYSRKDFPAILITLFLLLVLPLAVLSALTTQNLQQKAAEETPALESVSAGPKFVPDQVLVKFKDDAPQSNRDEALQAVQGRIDHTIEQIKVHVIKVPEGTVEKVVDALSHNPNVEFAEPDYIAWIEEIPNDPNFANQLFMQKIQAASAWDTTHGSASVVVADLDTGIDLQHPDLAAKIITSKVFTGEASDGDDNNGHGTKTSGIAAAITNNALGVAGVSYDAKLINGKIMDSSGSGSYSAMSDGIIWAADNNANVINISAIGSSNSTTLQSAINYAWNKGTVIVAAAGNCGDIVRSGCTSVNQILYPAGNENVLSVAATNSSDQKAYYTEYGTWVDVAAPVDGGMIYTTTNGGGYGSGNGTSFAAPQAAGLAALLAGQHPEWSNAQIVNQIQQTADKIAGTGTYWQYGRINAANAVGAPVSGTPTPTSAQSTPTPTTILTATPTSIPTATPTSGPADLIKPTISITSPLNGAIVPRRGTVTIAASASDNIGIDRVVFSVAGNTSTDFSTPYTYLWSVSGKPKANYTITATAYDAAGNSSLTSIKVTSSN